MEIFEITKKSIRQRALNLQIYQIMRAGSRGLVKSYSPLKIVLTIVRKNSFPLKNFQNCSYGSSFYLIKLH